MLDRIARREDVSIVRGDPYYHGLLALSLGRLNAARVELRIIGNHDAIYETVGLLAYPRLFRWRAVERRVAHFTLSRADAIVIGSDDNRAFAERNGAPPDRVTSLGNGGMIHPLHLAEPGEREAPEDEFGLGDRPLVVCVSRLERLKHPDDVIVSVAAARRRNPRIAAILVGDGAMRDELVALCEQLGVQDDVVFAGNRDQRWIARLLSAAAVVAAPLAGLSLVEAALSGTPIVGYDVEWHAEFLRAPSEAILVPYRDTDAMAAAICAIVADPELSARIALAARARALATIQPAKVVAEERAHADRLLTA
jgi:glycosyltransferase involved in cell wall biosynthesis